MRAAGVHEMDLHTSASDSVVLLCLQVLAGDPNLEAEVVQHGQRFRLDFSKVRGDA
jgi:tRNA G37 N-methylase Trm5